MTTLITTVNGELTELGEGFCSRHQMNWRVYKITPEFEPGSYPIDMHTYVVVEPSGQIEAYHAGGTFTVETPFEEIQGKLRKALSDIASRRSVDKIQPIQTVNLEDPNDDNVKKTQALIVRIGEIARITSAMNTFRNPTAELYSALTALAAATTAWMESFHDE